METDDAMRKQVMRKVAWRLSPFLGLLYFINYLDRTNISFAGPHGMNEALGFDKAAFGLASGLFFVGYLILEVPSNLALHKFGARRWIARIMVSWGIVASAMAFVPNAGTMYGLRVLLGIAEAGFFPGIILYLTFWFPKRERAKAVALFMLAVPLSSAIGAPLSAWLISAGHQVIFGLEGWRFMFLVEGVPAVIVGVVCWFYLTDRPRDAKWLNDDERAWLKNEMDTEDAQTAKRYHYPLKRALLQPRIWALAFVYFGIVYGLYAVGFFLPTIIAGFKETYHTNFSIFQQGLIVAIPYVFGGVAYGAVVPTRRQDPRTRLARGHSGHHRRCRHSGRALSELAAHRHDRGHHLHDGHLRRAADVLAAAHHVPLRRGRSRRHRADQLGRQRGRVPRPLHHRLADCPDRK